GDPGPVSPVTFTAVVRTGDDADRLVAHHHGTAGVTRDGQRLGGETVDHREVPRLRVRDERVAVDDVADDAVVLAADGAFLHGRGAARTPHLVTDVVHCDVADTGDRVRRRVEVVAARGRPVGDLRVRRQRVVVDGDDAVVHRRRGVVRLRVIPVARRVVRIDGRVGPCGERERAEPVFGQEPGGDLAVGVALPSIRG